MTNEPARIIPLRPRRGEDIDWFTKYAEWHPGCEGHHGVMRGVSPLDLPAVEKALKERYGPRCGWRQFRDGAMVYDLEFWDPKGRPRGATKPWHVCGVTVLFQDQQQHEQAAAQVAIQFSPGDPVVFPHRGETLHGLVATVGDRRCTVVVRNRGTYRLDARHIRKEAP